MITTFLKRGKDYFYFVFRVVIGIMFAMHGMQNLFGWYNVQYLATPFSLTWIGGIIMLVGGLLIAFGLCVRVSALLGAITMFVAYFWFHATWGDWWSPLANYGESAMNYFIAMLVLMAHGAGKWAVGKSG